MLTTAIERHLQWACDFAVAGDIDLALEAVRDARALSGELVIADGARDVDEQWFVTMSAMTGRDVLGDLRELAERSAQTADGGGSEANLLDAYESLRTRAETLAREHEWMSPHEFADLFPSPRALREIEQLDLAFGSDAPRALAPDRGMSVRLTEALNDLSAWATAVRLAYEARNDAGANP